MCWLHVMGTGSAQSSFLDCFPLHLGHGDPFLICQRQLPMAFPTSTYHHYPCHCSEHTNPHFYNCSGLSAVIPPWPGPSRWGSATQVARGSTASKFAGSHCHFFATPLSYYLHISQTNFPKLYRFLKQFKHFSHSLVLSSPSFWQEARPCWSGRLSVSGPKLTEPIGGGNHDLTNKKNRGIQLGGRLRFEEQWESHRACYCFSTTNRFFAAIGPFLS